MAEGPPESPPLKYRAIQINGPTFPSTSDTQAFGINCKGETVGIAYPQIGLLWLPNPAYGLSAGAHELVASEPGELIARSINSHGRIAGVRRDWTALDDILYLWDLSSHTSGPITGASLHEILGTITAINDSDTLIGTKWREAGNAIRAYRLQWDPSTGAGDPEFLEPEPFAGQSPCYAFAITIGASGLVAGDGNCGGPCWPDCMDLPGCHSFWQWEVSDAMGAYWPPEQTVGPHLDYLAVKTCPIYCAPRPRETEPRGVNSDDRIVGHARLPEDAHGPGTCPSQAVIWLTPGGPPMPLPLPPGHVPNQPTRANAISDVSPAEFVYVVGDNPQTERAIVWSSPASQVQTQGTWQALDLNEITDVRETEFTWLSQATGVNTMGWIAGWGRISDEFPFPTRAFVLVPVSGPDACLGDITGPLGVPNGRVGVPDLLELLTQWGVCSSKPDVPCWADLNNSGTVGVPDLLILLANWGKCLGNCDPTEMLSFEQEMSNRGISEARWNDFVDVLTNAPRTEQDRWICWLEHYLTSCIECRPCRGEDPFAD